MRLKDINAEITFELWMKPELSGETPNMGVGYIAPNNTGQAYRLRIAGQQWSMVLRDASAGKDLNFHFKRGCAHLAEVMQVAKDGSAHVKIIFFNGEIVEIGDVEIGIDERIESTAKRNGIRFNGAEELGSVLNEKCKISVGDEDFFLLMSGPSAKADFEADIPEDEDSPDSQSVVQEKYREFSIYGERVRIPVERRNFDKSKDIYFATKAVFRDNQKSEGSLRLARGAVQFSDYTKTGRIRALAAGAMSQLTKETGSYLKQWDEYGAIEGEMLLARAKAVGRIDFHGTEQTTKGVKFFVPSIPDQLTEGDEIEITSEEPLYLQNPDLTWEAYSKALEEEFTTQKDQKKNDAEMPASVYAPILKLSKTSIELDLPSIPSGPMFLILSINGDKIQIERRMRARSSILEGRCANPLLGLLIEEGGTLPDIQRVTKLKPLTSFVKEKIFKHPPTDRQVEAIDVALNTPDIALIQGPPGTGKTTVVTAILERLNEEYDKTKSIRGQILVSGFQHDAVENIVARLSVNALPAVKFGRRSGDSEFTADAVTEKINKWCSSVAENIRDKNPQIAQTEDQVRLGELFAAYSLCPSKNNTVNLMERILGLPRDVISEEITNAAEEIINSLQTELKPNDPSTLRFVRALRVSEGAFVDDGAARAVDLLDKIEDDSANLDLSVLKKAARWRSGKSLSFLPELRELKESLLYKYLPFPDFRIEKPREDVLRLVATVHQLLKKKLNSTNKQNAILAEFLHELEGNPDGTREAIEDYNFVYAATTQQAYGKDIIRSKNKNVRYDQRTEMVKYDTVIIDEAARTSPRDLLIPMSQAEKRIILVGDHRQLPHLIDEEVARALEGDDSSGPPVDVDFVKKSMFEYLFNRLKKLEEKDDIKRTVTLDAQYRTHPLLGDFASRNFYHKHNEGYRSPLSESHFGQRLQGIENKAAIWIDVPNSQGKEAVLPSRSRQRVSEAKVIAEHVNKWIGSEESSGLSFGVISFYKAQVFAVYEALQEFGITERAQDGTWQLCQEYRFLQNGEERLRIGTVDAFQGMEFDIVFLSMVRSQDINALPPHIRNEEDYKKKQQKLFGHLMSENRLCVSMSRQKKVLAIVGDGVLANTQIAVDAVPALKNFYDLCHEKGGGSMSAKPKDHRPKVISFRAALDGLNIAARQSVLWPCHAFNISIPQKKKSGLNVFEETILKITEIESGDTEKIALLTCLEKELVSFIQNRLNQLALLNDRYELSEHGQELLNEWQNKSDGNLEYTVATVFVDLLSGKLLPYVSTDQLSYKKISRIGDNGFIDFLVNPTNEKSRVSARQIRPAKDSFWKVVPDTNDIIRALREFKKKYKRHALLNQGVDQYPPPVPMAEAISLHENPELVYLHCNVLIQIGNSDLLVTDGCGFGFSESFANYLTSQDWKWVIDLKNKGVIDRLSSDQSNEEAEDESSAADGMKKYPRIARPLRRAQEYLSDAKKIDIDSSNDEQEFARLTGLAVVALYEAIEWALRFVVSDNPVSHWKRLFSSQSYRENNKILRSFAAKIGFDISDSVKALLQVKPGKIRAIDRGVSEMQPLLALAIAGAINDPNHPLNHLAIEDSGCLSFINILKEVRDPVSHGSSTDVDLSPETLEGYLDRTSRLIHSLIPDITEDAYAAKTKQERDIDQVRLKARIELDKSLGLGFVQAVPSSLREELLKVTILSQRETLDNEQLQRCINLLASIMQLSLFEVANDRRSSVKNQTNLRDEAIEKIAQSGFYPTPYAIPEQISTVNTKRLSRAVQGSSTTLGAHLLAVFLLGSESELIQLQKSDPAFIDFVANLIRLRGHGNKQQSDFSRDNMESLKNNVFKAIKIITEVF